MKILLSSKIWLRPENIKNPTFYISIIIIMMWVAAWSSPTLVCYWSSGQGAGLPSWSHQFASHPQRGVFNISGEKFVKNTFCDKTKCYEHKNEKLLNCFHFPWWYQRPFLPEMCYWGRQRHCIVWWMAAR